MNDHTVRLRMNMQRMDARDDSGRAARARRRQRVRGRAVRRRRAGGVASGEVVFNTALSRLPGVITDPSYAGQIITFTNPHIGNYGVNAADFESRRPFCRGVVVRELARRHSNRRAEGDLDAMLARYGVPGIAGIDTRRLTRLIRDTGAIPGAFGTGRRAPTLRGRRRGRARHRRRRPRRRGHDARAVHGRRRAARSRSSPTTSGSSARSCATSPASARSRSCRPRRRPPTSLARRPDGVFLSNGPGDPAMVPYADRGDRASCSAACPSSASASATSCSAGRSAADTVKLPFGHHGGNHPVQNLTTGRDRDHQPEPQLRRRPSTRSPASPT